MTHWRERASTATTNAAELVIWTLVLVGLWIATLTTVNVVEVVAAVVVAVPLAGLALAARRLLDTRPHPRAAWAGWLVRLPVAVLVDTGRLAVALVRSVRRREPLGGTRTLALPDEPDDVRHTRSALGALAISTTPGSYVTGVADGAFEVHALTAEPTALERAVTR